MSVDAKRNARIELTAGTAGMDSGLADAKRKMRAFEREQKRDAKRLGRAQDKIQGDSERVWGGRGSRLGGMIGNGIGLALGGDLVSQFSDAVSGIADFERELTRFQIDAQLSGRQIGDFRDQVMAASQATGQSRIAILQGAHAYQVLTGDSESAMKSAKLFGEVANASGASMDDIATAAASLHNNSKFGSDDMRQAFDVILSMGHKSNIELRQMAGEMNRLLPLFNQFGNSSNMNKYAEAMASFEVIGPSFKGPEEAAEGFQQIMMQLSKPKVAANFEGLGVKIWDIDPKTKLHVQRDWLDIIGDIKKKIPDREILGAALGGRVNAILALKGMVDNYDRLVQLKQEALGSDQVAKDNATYMESTSGKIAVAWTHIKNSIAEALTPERIEALATALTEAADAFVSAIKATDEWLSAVSHAAFGGGGGKEVEVNTAVRELFLNNTEGQGGTAATEKSAVANAQDIISNPKQYEGTQWAHDYGGVGNLMEAAKKYLASEGIKDPWATKGGKSDQAEMTKAMAELPQNIAAALADALRSAGIAVPASKAPPVVNAHVKVGAEVVQKAAANSIEHRRGRNH